MDYIQITKENIDKEHICCAMSGKQSLAKKEWLKQRFAEGLVFYRSVERGKCFIEYIPAENAWVPITADGWLYINCLWVSGSMKGHGCSNDLLEKCLSDARAQGKKGICILCAEGRKREFLADPKFLSHKGFEVADVSDCGITLMCLPLNADTALPKFKNCAKHPKADGEGFVLYYTDQCPFTYYWVPKVQQAAQQNNIPFRAIYIIRRIFQTVLVQHPRAFCQAHTGQTVILRHNQVPGLHPVDECKIHTVSAFVKYQRLCPFSLDAMGCIAQNHNRHTFFPCAPQGQIDHRAAVCIDQNCHVLILLRHGH